MANDVMLSGMGNGLCQFLTKDEMKTKAPFIFATEPTSPKVSEKYVFANTETIVDDMAKLGWGVVDCKQQRANKRSNIHSMHMIAFQSPDVYITKVDESGNDVVDGEGKPVIDVYPRIILTNSHDGFHAFKFMVGIFRTVCSNGLIIATDTFANISIRHSNYDFEELRKIVAVAIKNVSDNIAVMNEMQETELSQEQKEELALSALKIRKGLKPEDKYTVDGEDIQDILTPTRKEDEGNSLWNVFNILQEKIIKGNFMMNSPTNKRPRKARAIKGVAKDIEINQNLFKVASSYRVAM